MKLLRYGPKGSERLGILDESGALLLVSWASCALGESKHPHIVKIFQVYFGQESHKFRSRLMFYSQVLDGVEFIGHGGLWGAAMFYQPSQRETPK